MPVNFDSFFVFFGIAFVLVIAVFIFVFSSVISHSAARRKREKQNDASPVITVDAVLVTKRYEERRSSGTRGAGNIRHTTYYKYYYATFEFESGDRAEYEIEPSEYGLLAERDKGKLTFQGTRYLKFERLKDQ